MEMFLKLFEDRYWKANSAVVLAFASNPSKVNGIWPTDFTVVIKTLDLISKHDLNIWKWKKNKFSVLHPYVLEVV